ncbi:MAG: ATP-binding cassette domain-containing protein [Desulfobacterales bacterium]|nr:ATP-binding cassette domain-containing protein [Desulfobacterales bacterium]
MGFGGADLLDGVDLEIHAGDRICLLGRNGTGKTTLLKLISGDIKPDSGEIFAHSGVRTARLPQNVPPGLSGTVYDVVAAGLGETGHLLAELRILSECPDDASMRKRAKTESRLAELEGWGAAQRMDRVITRLELDADAPFADLSAGVKRRTLLARALVAEPDLLLLDEPTNHLDIAAIDRLEAELEKFSGTLVFITHDRAFLRRFARRIVSIGRGRLTAWDCDYDTFLMRQADRNEAENTQNAVFDKKLAAEETWIRSGIKARRTRNMGRVRALEQLREQRRARRERIGSVRMQIQEAQRTGKLVISAEDVDYAWDTRPVIREFSATVMRGDKVGIIGPNGAGKTTLLQLLLGDLPPDRGHLRHGTRLQVAYFDQLRAQLDPDKSVADNLADGKDRIAVGDQTRHVIGYLQDFLFTPERSRSPVRILSGGERNRLLLARLFARPSNVLVLDEPTNDLDMETVELLEERLMDYPGTLLLVSHDRAFLNNMVTSTLVLDGSGTVTEFIGGYDDWIRQRDTVGDKKSHPEKETSKEKPRAPSNRQIKLGFNEKRELEVLPGRIEALEAEQKRLYETMTDPAFYQQDGGSVAAASDRLKTIEKELAEAYERWEYLESVK